MDSIDYYERQGSQYFEETIDLDMTDHLRRFLDRLPENAEVLDLGCGSGALLLMAAERCEELMLAGVDQSCAAVANAKENLEQNGLHGAIWMGDVSRRDALPNGGSFDLVLCNPP